MNSNIDIIKRIANTREGRVKMNLPNKKIQVSTDSSGYSFIYEGGYTIISESKIETVVIRDILLNIIPEDYKIEITQIKCENKNYSTRCSVHSIRNHHTMSFSYGKNPNRSNR